MFICLSAAELKDAGLSTYQIRMAAQCCLKRVRRGWYVVAGPCTNPEHEVLTRLAAATSAHLPKEEAGLRKQGEDHRILVRSYAENLPPGSAMSHMSALVVHGLPVPFFRRGERLRVETVHPRHSISGARIHIRQRTVAEDDIVSENGIRVTSIPRTLWDIGRDYPLPFSVAVADAAMHCSLVSEAELRAFFNSHPARTRQSRLDQMLDLVDARRESVGESICAVRFVEHGITGFEPQVEFVDKYGQVEARPDFTNREAEVIAEVDGRGKYYLSGNDPEQAFEAERRREYLLRNRGYRVFRIRWPDLFKADVFLTIKSVVAQRRGQNGRESAS